MAHVVRHTHLTHMTNFYNTNVLTQVQINKFRLTPTFCYFWIDQRKGRWKRKRERKEKALKSGCVDDDDEACAWKNKVKKVTHSPTN